MASELKMSERVVNYRIRRLVKEKVITGFRTTINYGGLDIHFYKTFIYLDNLDVDRIRALIGYFRRNRNVIHNVRVMGNWDLEPEFEVYSESEFNKIITEVQDSFSDIIRNIEVVTISKEHKFVYYD
jgi:DNA-binding Lrp family transcriptional regulator